MRDGSEGEILKNMPHACNLRVCTYFIDVGQNDVDDEEHFLFVLIKRSYLNTKQKSFMSFTNGHFTK